METKLITNDSFFDEEHLWTLEDGIKYAILVADQIFFFIKEKGFLENFLYTITLYKKTKTKNLLIGMFSAKYQNSDSAKKSAKIILEKLVFKKGQVGILDLEQQNTFYFHIKKKRNAYTRSQLELKQLLAKKDIEESKGFRVKTIGELSKNAQHFLDTTVAYRKFFDLDSDYFPGVGIEYSVTDKYTECGYGRSSSFQDSTNIAQLEAIERFSSMYYPYKTKDIYGKFSDLPSAVHPEKFILPSSDKNPFTPYRNDLEIYWTEAESLKNNKNVLIPEQLAVYGDSFFRDKKKQHRFIYDSSNGVSLGGTFEEAVLYGLLELIERDNFLTTWYGRIPVEEVTIKSLGLSGDILKIINRAQHDGFDVRVFDISMELGVPSFWALVRSLKDHKMYAYTAAGSNPIPHKAAESALLEALVGIKIHDNMNAEFGMEVPSEVTEMEDHVNYYSSSQHKAAFDFLEASHVTNLSPQKYIQENSTRSYLKELIQRVLEKYDDVFVVNLTSKEMEELGIYTVKVIVPGLLPITFGVQNERISMSRINRERSRRGLKEMGMVNSYPHPFP
ncbi:YcaO-like family protein [Streptococcus hyointestinalis]|uniref:Bacteriocin biosynthesis docking scaffold, SagD family n=1 Tax=Streptococcus hyointestinalis TaxID=1337 RepID=A0A380JZB5_9STRE|nr:YcaO-like family protein [Streptococcus hyointestinalis]SUN58088.1 bacteriocin biosynthesis docking scaffold, SagD family [Streptococcus hyointestinalis]